MTLWNRAVGWLSRERPDAVLPPADRGADVLAYLQVGHAAVGWARGQRAGLEHLWERCPRADWLLQIALGAGVGKKELAQAVGKTVIGESVREATAAWVRDEISNQDWCRQIGQADDERADRLVPKVAMHDGGSEFSDDQAGFEASRAEDAEEASVRREFLAVVREAVPYRAIHALIYASDHPPYRG